jgi:hypothetical protein
MTEVRHLHHCGGKLSPLSLSLSLFAFFLSAVEHLVYEVAPSRKLPLLVYFLKRKGKVSLRVSRRRRRGRRRGEERGERREERGERRRMG